MLLYKGRTVLIVSFLFFLISCSNDIDIDDVPKEHVNKISEANNALGFSTLATLQQNKNGDENIFISPTSLYTALLLAYNGSDEGTKAEFSDLLEITDQSDEELNEAMYSLIDSLLKDTKDIEVTSANSLWLSDTYTFQTEYKEAMEKYFNAQVEAIDITDDGSANKINKWVQKETNDKIKDIIEAPLQENFVALLVNVLYFNGEWQFEFDEQQTEDDTFYATEKDVQVPFMQLEEELAYMENKDVQAVQLPYGEGDMMMQVYLPKEDTDMTEFVATTLSEEWETWQDSFEESPGTIFMPKFELEYEIVLNDILQELGLEQAFSNKADFSRMVEETNALKISEVKQKTYVDVNEQGTEAAAATSVEIVETSAIIEDPFEMKVDRPFIFTITDVDTDAILFLGKIENPSET